ncbi:MAG: DivIVA domain-containing protein [Erysipelotrichaceae bacterium]|jgi:DivIVA domain-containing protein|nr:DivIVA domain-containing protein [Erysipelotrichaceae bacterium]
MSSDEIKLTPTLILHKEFKVKIHGAYDAREVDSFLDIINSDYEAFFDIVENKKRDIAVLKHRIIRMELENTKLLEEVISLRKIKNANTSKNNLELIQEINRLQEENNRLKQELRNEKR